MDLLCNAYSASSDDDKQSETLPPTPLKRPKLEPSRTITRRLPVIPPNHAPIFPNEAPIAGRYISKRERAALAAAAPPSLDPNSPTQVTSSAPVLGSISDSQIRHDILSWLRHPTKGRLHSNQISERLSTALHSHTKAVNALQWSKTHLCSSSSCIRWHGSDDLHMERVEQREESTRVGLSHCSCERC